VEEGTGIDDDTGVEDKAGAVERMTESWVV
jgi:hypothetical protein